ncbi:MAG: PAS domain S-box protein [Chloroflexota bacterium]
MVNVPYPKNEAERLHALQTLNILDTPSEERFDRVTRLAKRLLGMPIVMVTMVDEDRQWFKSRIGVDLVETPRELSICTYTILEDEVLIIPDMQQDQRFISHPFVVDEPHIRFYAGYPLSTPDGHRVGTLCVLDTQPHSFDDEQIEILQDLANIAQTELNLAEVKQLQADLTTLTHSLEDEIIDHNRTIEKLRQQQVFLRQIIDLNPHLIFARNREGVFTLANKAFAAIYGVSPETLCGKDDIDFQLDPQIIEAYREDDLAIMNTRQESVTPEQSITTTEGEKRWWNITKRPIVNEDGSVDQILGVVTDITERKRAEIELQKSEEQFRLVFELAPIGMAVVGFDGRFRSINQAFCQTLGYTTQEMLQKTIADITHPDDLETALDQGLLQGTIPHFQTERRYIHKSGKQITAILQVTLVRNTDGTPQHFIVQVVDITERTRAEVALKQQEAFLKQVIDTVPHLIYVKDSAGRFTLINQAVADLYGTPIENILGKRDVDFDIIEDAMMRFLDQDKPVLERGEEMLIPEETVVDAKGQTHWLQTTKRPIIEADHSIKQVVSIAIDITEQKWAEETIRDSQQRLALHFQNTPVGVIEWSPDFEVVDWNPAARRIFGYTRDEVLGKRGSFLMSTGTQEFFDTIWHNLLKKNKGTSGIQPNIRKNRKEIICQWFNTPLRDEKGQIIGVTSLIEDITERRAAEQALRENEARLVKMTANAPGLIFQFVLREDQTGYFSYASAWMRDILGLQPEDLSMDAMPGTSAIHPEDRHDFLRTLGESARLLSHWHWVGRMVSKSGKVIHVQGDAKPELMESGETVWNGVIMDISGRIQAEEERDRLFNLSVDMMAIGGVDGYFKRLNPAFETMLGYTHQELIENPIVEFMHPDDVESIVNHVKAFAVAEPSETFHFENRF